MGKCDNCRLRKESAKAFDIHWMGTDDCPYDKCPVPDFPKTNADSIRSMSDEELANLFENWIQDCGCNNVPCSEPCKRDREREITDWRDALEHKSCYDCWLDWLRQEAKE